MGMVRFVPDEGLWLKGNLHAHSTLSDGNLTPDRVIAAYEERGYDFFALTDHDYYARYAPREKMILIPGFELAGYMGSKRVHLNVFEKGPVSRFVQGQRFSIQNEEETRAFIEEYQDEYLFMLNHPDWSLLEYRDIEAYDQFFALEVMNWGTEYYDGIGEGSYFWETGLRYGRRWGAIATDDNHNGYTDEPGWPFGNTGNDSFGAWIMVKAKERTRQAIIAALEAGHYYASTGPEIHSFTVEDGWAEVHCSPVSRIIFSGEKRNLRRRLGENLTHFRAPLRGNKEHVKVRIIDDKGKTAYSNPIYLKDV